jgi:hypothetical protein
VKKRLPILYKTAIWLCLLVYGLSVLGWDGFHQAIHAEAHHTEHTVEQEQNPCHVAFYHQGEDCGHETHVQESQACDLCQIHHAIDFAVVHFQEVSVNQQPVSFQFYYLIEASVASQTIHADRGPPASC